MGALAEYLLQRAGQEKLLSVCRASGSTSQVSIPRFLCSSREPTASTSSAEQPAHIFHYQHLHQQDIITARDAQLFLATELDAWQALPHPRLPFFIDRAVNPRGRAHDGHPFFFVAFLTGFSWGRDIVLQVK